LGQTGRITHIAAAGESSLAVTSSGQVYGFGDNYYGQLGNCTSNSANNPNPTPAQASLPPGTTIDTIAKGEAGAHALAIVSDLSITTSSPPTGRPGSLYPQR
jgi:alpha-tubulin suppressor-like RCC1 family protein